PLTVNYHFGANSTATRVADFAALSGSVKIARGRTYAYIYVTPVDDSLSEGDESVVLKIDNGVGYRANPLHPSTSVIIHDNDISEPRRWSALSTGTHATSPFLKDLTGLQGDQPIDPLFSDQLI